MQPVKTFFPIHGQKTLNKDISRVQSIRISFWFLSFSIYVFLAYVFFHKSKAARTANDIYFLFMTRKQF